MRQFPVRAVSWGDTTAYRDGVLTISREELLAHLEATGDLGSLELVELALVTPDTPTRIVNILDVVGARARLGEGAVDYPGVCGPLRPIGDGVTAELQNFTVLALSTVPDLYNKLLDLSGPGAEVTPYSRFCHLAIQATPKQPDMPKPAYLSALKRLALRAGAYLARAAAASEPASARIYTLDPQPEGLPRAVYVCMIASHQKAEAGEAILYGDDAQGLLPTILHPNELLDGAVISPIWNLGIDTYSFQANPVVEALYNRHGKELAFSGVVVNVAHITRERRERSVLMAANLVSTVLKADLAVITKVGGGIPESDTMMLIEALEQKGVKTSAILWSHYGDGNYAGDSLSAYSPAADAVASAGVYDAWFELGPQETVIGGRTAGPFTTDPSDRARPAEGPLKPRIRDIAGAISQLGASRVGMVEA